MDSSRAKALLLVAAAIITYALAAFHAAFWVVFDWPDDLGRLTFENRAIMQALNVSLIYLLAVIASVSLFRRRDLLETSLGRLFSASVAGFWVVRLAVQAVFFGFGDPLSYVMSGLFVLMAVPYVLAALPEEPGRGFAR